MTAIHDSSEPLKVAPQSTLPAANSDAQANVVTGPTNHSKDGLALATAAVAPQGSLTALSAVRSARAAAIDPNEGYAQYFEKRLDYLWDRPVWVVIAESVRKRPVGDLKMVEIDKVFARKDEVAIGFGTPNVFTFFPAKDGNGFEKFAAKWNNRAPATIEGARLVQSAPFARLLNLAPAARVALRDAFEAQVGKTHDSCAFANAIAFHNAGFRIPGVDLRKIYRPIDLFHAVVDHGLYWNDQKVDIGWVRTTEQDLETHHHDVVVAEVTTPWRHFRRKIDPKLEALGWFRFIAAIKSVFGVKDATATTRAPKVIAPALELSGPEKSDFVLRVSQPGWLGGHLRRAWGPHMLFELNQNRVKIDDYLPVDLPAYPGKLSFGSRVKSAIFNPFTLWVMHRIASPNFVELDAVGERDIHRMLRTDADGQPNRYNIIIKRKSEVMEDGSSITVVRTKVRYKWVDWWLTKHLFASKTSKQALTDLLRMEHGKVAYAAEVRKAADGRIPVNMNSGTFQPTKKQQEQVIAFLSAVFPNAEFVAVND